VPVALRAGDPVGPLVDGDVASWAREAPDEGSDPAEERPPEEDVQYPDGVGLPVVADGGDDHGQHVDGHEHQADEEPNDKLPNAIPAPVPAITPG
jgi:hypothetical protein